MADDLFQQKYSFKTKSEKLKLRRELTYLFAQSQDYILDSTCKTLNEAKNFLTQYSEMIANFLHILAKDKPSSDYFLFYDYTSAPKGEELNKILNELLGLTSQIMGDLYNTELVLKGYEVKMNLNKYNPIDRITDPEKLDEGLWLAEST